MHRQVCDKHTKVYIMQDSTITAKSLDSKTGMSIIKGMDTTTTASQEANYELEVIWGHLHSTITLHPPPPHGPIIKVVDTTASQEANYELEVFIDSN